MMSSRQLGSLLTWLVSAGIAAGCAGDGCSCVQPIPGGYPEEQRVPNAIQVRVSDTGLDKIEADPSGVIAGLIGNGMGLTFDVPASCSGDNQTCCVNNVPQSPCGPIEIDLAPQGASEQPGQANARLVVDPVTGDDRVHVTMRARVKTLSDLSVTIGSLGMTCNVHVNTRDAGNQSITLALDAQFSQESWGATRVDFENVAITNFDDGDVTISPGDIACIALEYLFKPLVVPQFVDQFSGAITDMLNGQVCKSCDSGNVAECGSTHATACNGDNVCEVSAGKCYQELGLTGRMTGDALLGNASPGTLGSIDIYDVAGGYAATDGVTGAEDGDEGVSLGIYGGMLPSGQERDRCGPPATAPAAVSIAPSPYFQGNTNPDDDQPFDFALGVHKSNLDAFAYSAYEGGLMCLNIGTRTIDLLTSETLAVLFPSFIDLLHGKVGALVLGLRPQSPPAIVLGLGTSDDNGTIIEPLLDVTFTDLEVDFFGMVDDQYIRLMTLVADVHLPINLDVDDMGQIVPVLGDLDNAFTDLSVKNSEALAETPAELADKFPALLELALPLVAEGLGGFALPELGGLRLVIPDGGITAVDNKQFLAIFGNFEIAAAAAPAPVNTEAVIVGAQLPDKAVYAADRLDQNLRPRVQLRLGGSRTDGSAAALEWSVKVNGGLWSPYTRNPELVLARRQFWLPGRHRIEVRAREIGKPWTTDRTPVVLTPMLHPDGQLPDKPRPIYFHGQSSGGGCDCATGMGARGAGGAALLLAVLVLAMSRRTRRLLGRHGLPLALVLLAAAAPAGCSCGSSPACAGEGGECLDGEVARGPLGRWDSIATDGDRTVVAAYEESYGDLVLVDVSGEWTYTAVDGLPADVLPVYHPDTYRGGFVEPGPNIGGWTSVTLRDGEARIAYQDLDQGVLKFASESRDGWVTHVVDADTAGGSVGLYASLAWDPDGNPAIAYMAAGMDDGSGGKKSQLRLAVAQTASPAAESDWTVSILDEAAVSCAGLCGDGLTCLPATDTVPEHCSAITTDCPADCGTDEECILGACVAIVPAPAAHELPGGTGLFARLGYLPDGRAVVVYYQRALGDLMMQVNATGWQEVSLDASTATDTGMFASMAIDSGGAVHVAYQDALGDRLLYVRWAGSVGPVEVVDDGVRSGDRTHPVGAGSAIVAPDGNPIIAYQDGLTSDLIAARKAGSSWNREDVQVGVHLDGFFTSAASASGRAVVSSYRYDRSYYPPGELVVTELP